MSRADDKIKKIYEDARAAMKRLSDKNYRYVGQDSVYDDLRTVQKLIDSSEEALSAKKTNAMQIMTIY